MAVLIAHPQSLDTISLWKCRRKTTTKGRCNDGMPPGGKSKSLPIRGGCGTAPPFIDSRGVKPLWPRTGLLLVKLPFPNRKVGSRLRLETFFNFFSDTCSRPGCQTHSTAPLLLFPYFWEAEQPSDTGQETSKHTYNKNTEDHDSILLQGKS